MEAKYYTPQVDEFFVGFEFEELNILSVYDDHWKVKVKKEVFTQELWRSGYSNWNFLDKLQEGKIRVKYLDKEDIESLGFKGNDILFEYKNFTIFLLEDRILISEELIDNLGIKNQCRRFEGNIKNKSELKQVLKMLGIE